MLLVTMFLVLEYKIWHMSSYSTMSLQLEIRLNRLVWFKAVH